MCKNQEISKPEKYLHKILLVCVAAALLAGMCFVISLIAPDIYDWILTSYVEPKVVMVGDATMDAHGTGFFIKGTSGNMYVLTNSHVCRISSDDVIYIKWGELNPVPRRIIAISGETDLCLIEAGFWKASALELAGSYSALEKVISFGFPLSFGFVSSKGVALRYGVSAILEGEIKTELDLLNCSGPKYKIVKYDGQRFCVMIINSTSTSIVTFGGNSGSPVVNFWGNVVGIIFATHVNAGYWGVIVDKDEIEDFIREY